MRGRAVPHGKSRALLQVHVMVDRNRQLLQEKLAALAADLQISELPCTGLFLAACGAPARKYFKQPCRPNTQEPSRSLQGRDSWQPDL